MSSSIRSNQADSMTRVRPDLHEFVADGEEGGELDASGGVQAPARGDGLAVHAERARLPGTIARKIQADQSKIQADEFKIQAGETSKPRSLY